jgi:hypothetical protein
MKVTLGKPAGDLSAPADRPLPTTVDITPSAEGFVSIAAVFATQILDDVKVTRKVSDRLLLDSLIETVAYLARTDMALVESLRKAIR